MSKVNESIENNEYKDNVRDEIVKQIVEWANRLAKKNLHVLTLPGENWFFENKLIKACKKAGITVTGVAFEYNPQKPYVWRTMRLNAPEGFKAVNQKIQNWANHEVQLFDIAWFDFCGYPLEGNRKAVRAFVETHPVSLTYATFSMLIRLVNGEQQMAKDVWPFGKVDGIREATQKRLWFDVRNQNPNKNDVKEIFRILYCGGESMITGMQTLGYQSGKVKTLTKVEEDWETPVREQRRIANNIAGELTESEREAIKSFYNNEVESYNARCEEIRVLLKQVDALLSLRSKEAPTISILDADEFIRELCRKGFNNQQIFEACKFKVKNDDCFFRYGRKPCTQEEIDGKTVYLPTKKRIHALTVWVRKEKAA